MSMDRIRQDLAQARQDLGLGGRAALVLQVTDAALGRPAAGLSVTLTGADGHTVGGRTDAQGQAAGAVAPGAVTLGVAAGAWFAAQQRATCHPEIELRLVLADAGPHHVTLLLGPFGYTVAWSA